MTYASIDICRLTSSQKILLCNAALEDLLRLSNNKERFETPPRGSEYSICTRSQVTLSSLEADDFKINQFSMIACYNSRLLKDDYYLGKNHFTDSATIYKRIGFLNQYYPHTLIHTIDMFKLIHDAQRLLQLFAPLTIH